ncbi:tetratricopeptide repeat protein [Nitrosomonas ureae]|nr:tetratricopeptide repeat protein [Nitrosomonas ureae]
MNPNLICILLLVLLCGIVQAKSKILDAGNNSNAQVEAADPQQAMLEQARSFRQSHPELFGEAKGVLVTDVVPGSQGEKAGLKSGDILLTYDNTFLNSSEHLFELTGTKDENEAVTLSYQRNRELHNVVLKGGRIGVQIASLILSETELSMQQMQLLNEKGSEAYRHSRFKEALQQFKQGLGIASTQKHYYWQSQFQNNLGIVYESLSQYPQALDHLQQSLAIRLKISDRNGEGDSLNNLGLVYHRLGQFLRSLDYHQQSLAIKREIGDRNGEANSLGNLGIVYTSLDQYPLALDHLQQSLVIKREFGDRNGEVNNLGSMGIVYQSLGQYSQALDHLQQSLTIVREIGNRYDEAKILENLGNVYEILGHYPQALDHYQQSLANRRKIGDRTGEATSLNNLGNVLYRLGQYPQALDHYQQSLAIQREIGSRTGEATSVNNLGLVYLNLRQYPLAQDHFLQSLAIKREIGDRKGEATSLNNLGLVYQNLGQYPLALDHFQQSLVLTEQLLGEKHPDTARVLFNYAILHHALDQTTRAIFYGKRAINVLQASRESNRQLSVELLKSFLESQESSYRTVADWLLEAGRLAEAEQVLAMLKEEEQFQYLRRNQSAAKTLSTRTVCTRWEEEHCQQYQQLSYDLREADKAWHETEKQVRAGVEVEQKRLNELQQLFKTRKSAFEQGLMHINTALSAWQGNPEYKLHVEKDILQRSNRLRRSLKDLGHGAVSLHYLLMEDGVRIILTTPDKQITRNTEIKLVTLRRKVGAMRQALLRQQEQVDYKALSQELYALLIFPVADELAAANAQTLMVSLDGILRYLPFAALYDGQQFLIERYAVNFQTLAARTDLNIRPQPNWQISGFGVSQAADVVDPVTLKPINFVSLPFVATELKTLIRQNDKEAGLLPGEIYLDEAFSKQKLTQVLTREQPSPVIHIGSHFELRPGDNSRSFLLLGQNTILTMAEVYDENLDFSGADLVTLSACDTAMGEDNALSNGAEIESFGVLVQELGAKSVMATLWPVIDESTSFFMKSFYQLREQNKLTKAEALRQAQLSMITSGDKFSQPYYWAPFVLMGNWL